MAKRFSTNNNTEEGDICESFMFMPADSYSLTTTTDENKNRNTNSNNAKTARAMTTTAVASSGSRNATRCGSSSPPIVRRRHNSKTRQQQRGGGGGGGERRRRRSWSLFAHTRSVLVESSWEEGETGETGETVERDGRGLEWNHGAPEETDYGLVDDYERRKKQGSGGGGGKKKRKGWALKKLFRRHASTPVAEIMVDETEGDTGESPLQVPRAKHAAQAGAVGRPQPHAPALATVTHEQHTPKWSPSSRKAAMIRRISEGELLAHNPKNPEQLMELLRYSIDVNRMNTDGAAPIHAIVQSGRKTKDKMDLLMVLLVHSDMDVSLPAEDGNTALHYAVLLGEIQLVKLLIAFGANVNAVNDKKKTPLDIALSDSSKKDDALIDLIPSVGGYLGAALRHNFFKLPRLQTFKPPPWNVNYMHANSATTSTATDAAQSSGRLSNDKLQGRCRASTETEAAKRNSYSHRHSTAVAAASAASPRNSVLERIVEEDIRLEAVDDDAYDVVDDDDDDKKFSQSGAFSCPPSYLQQHHKEFEDGLSPSTLYERLQFHVNRALELTSSFSGEDEAIALAHQERELIKYKRTRKEMDSLTEFEVKGGSRILCMDGGGMKGLVQIEVLCRLEEETGRSITELFDFIIGTSTGGIVALGLVYAKMSLKKLRRLYYRFKDEVFSSVRLGFGFNTEAFEQLLRAEFGTEMRMSDVKYPRVLVSAVNKKTSLPELHFFNNCFGDEFSNELVWKVARYTTAAPMFFSECDDYVDGGVLANNPCDYGMSAIQNFYRHQKERLQIALVVSLGSGIYPAQNLGKVNVQEFFFFGKHWFSSVDTIRKRANNLLTLLTTALVESEAVAENCKTRLLEQRIPFYRFSPRLDEVVPAGETDTQKLVDMVIQTRTQVQGGQEIKELLQLFHLVAELTHQERNASLCRQKATKMRLAELRRQQLQ